MSDNTNENAEGGKFTSKVFIHLMTQVDYRTLQNNSNLFQGGTFSRQKRGGGG